MTHTTRYRQLTWMSWLMVILVLPACKKDSEPAPTPPPAPTTDLNPGPCDEGLPLAVGAAWDAAKAMDICKTAANAQDWGLITASFIRANDEAISANAQFGIMETFGANNPAQRGQRQLVLSNGSARTPTQPQYCGTSCLVTGIGSAPPGLPTPVPGCPVSSNIHDDAGLKLLLRVPSSATGFSIDHKLFTFDHPILVCSAFNDQFVILVDPAPVGSLSGNVAFDANSRPIGANASFMLSDAETSHFVGTGFGPTSANAGTTGWLRTSVPVTAGQEITIRLLIYDVGDGTVNSTVLLDNFRWLSGSVTLGTAAI